MEAVLLVFVYEAHFKFQCSIINVRKHSWLIEFLQIINLMKFQYSFPNKIKLQPLHWLWPTFQYDCNVSINAEDFLYKSKTVLNKITHKCQMERQHKRYILSKKIIVFVVNVVVEVIIKNILMTPLKKVLFFRVVKTPTSQT